MAYAGPKPFVSADYHSSGQRRARAYHERQRIDRRQRNRNEQRRQELEREREVDRAQEAAAEQAYHQANQDRNNRANLQAVRPSGWAGNLPEVDESRGSDPSYLNEVRAEINRRKQQWNQAFQDVQGNFGYINEHYLNGRDYRDLSPEELRELNERAKSGQYIDGLDEVSRGKLAAALGEGYEGMQVDALREHLGDIRTADEQDALTRQMRADDATASQLNLAEQQRLVKEGQRSRDYNESVAGLSPEDLSVLQRYYSEVHGTSLDYIDLNTLKSDIARYRRVPRTFDQYRTQEGPATSATREQENQGYAGPTIQRQEGARPGRSVLSQMSQQYRDNRKQRKWGQFFNRKADRARNDEMNNAWRLKKQEDILSGRHAGAWSGPKITDLHRNPKPFG